MEVNIVGVEANRANEATTTAGIHLLKVSNQKP